MMLLLCRVQVKKFEEKYMAAHGVLPKGKARAPLKEVYSRYRYLKQAVRGVYYQWQRWWWVTRSKQVSN